MPMRRGMVSASWASCNANHVRDVAAGTERLPRAREYDTANAIVRGNGAQPIEHRAAHLVAEGVQPRRVD